MWYQIIKGAKVTGKPYDVIEVDQTMIYDLKQLFNKSDWVYNTDQEKIQWSKIRVVHCTSEKPGRLFYKINLGDEYSEFNMFEKSTAEELSNDIKRFQDRNFELAYPSELKISADKYKDLKSLCDTLAIPIEHHSYYEKLRPAVHNEMEKSDDDSDSEPDEDEILADRVERKCLKQKRKLEMKKRAKKIKNSIKKKKLKTQDSTVKNLNALKNPKVKQKLKISFSKEKK